MFFNCYYFQSLCIWLQPRFKESDVYLLQFKVIILIVMKYHELQDSVIISTNLFLIVIFNPFVFGFSRGSRNLMCICCDSNSHYLELIILIVIKCHELQDS